MMSITKADKVQYQEEIYIEFNLFVLNS